MFKIAASTVRSYLAKRASQFDVLKEQLRGMNLPPEDYVIFGSGPMAQAGLRDVNDLDVVTRGKAWNMAKALSGVKPAATKSGVGKTVRIGDIELFNKLGPGKWDTNQIIESAERKDDLPFADFDTLMKWKAALGREKDLRDIATIQEYLKNNHS